MTNPLLTHPLDRLRQRRSLKWRQYEPDVLPMWLAEMDVELAEPVRRVLVEAVTGGDTGYAHLDGLAVAYRDFAEARFGWRPDPAATSLVADVMQGIVAVLAALTGPRGRVVVTTPVYPPFFSFLAEIGREVVPVPLAPDFRVDLVGLERAFAAGAEVLLLCNPHNPTGTVWSRAELIAVAVLADRYGVRVLVDEIHSPLVYPGAVHTPFLSLDLPAARRAFAFVSASKAWNLAGLKAALVIAGPDALDDRDRLSANLPFAAGLFGVLAGEAALRQGGGWLAELLAGLDHNRLLLADLLARQLPQVRYRVPEATYLAWLDCRALGLGDDPAAVFLERGRLGVSPGTPFGAPGFVRLNFACHPDLLTEAVHRMAVSCP